MKIAIIGAGISGLTLSLWLRKLRLLAPDGPLEVQIFERRPSTLFTAVSEDVDPTYSSSLIGGSLGLVANGLRSLRKLDAELYDEVMSTGNRVSSWRMSAARGFTLADVAVRGKGEESVMIGREDFVACLRKRVPERVVRDGKVVEVRDAGEGGVKVVRFEDGSEERVDLVVGADGIWSVVRRSMFAVDGKDGEYGYAPHYEGLVGVGSFVPANMMAEVPLGQMNIVFGRNGFFGYGIDRNTAEGGRGIWWSTYTLAELPADWRKIDVTDAERQLQARHKHWKNAVIQRLIAEAKVDRVWPTYITPPLPTWESEGCVLIGDAAHALQPSSGQGTSMAMEDAEAFARLLARHFAQDAVGGHAVACKQYSDLRMPRLARLHKRAQQLGRMKQDMGVVQEFVMYLFVWAMGFFGFGKEYNEFVFKYDVEEAVKEMLSKSRVQERRM